MGCGVAPVSAMPHSAPGKTLLGYGRHRVTWDIQSLFRSHALQVTRSLTRRGMAMDVAEDLTQDVFVRLLDPDRSQPVQQGGRDPGPLLLRIARNLMIDQWRRERLLPRVALTPDHLANIADPSPLAEQRIYARQRLELTARALGEMPERTRRAFELHRIEGWTIAEVSAELGISTTRGWTLIQDAYRRIRHTLNEG